MRPVLVLLCLLLCSPALAERSGALHLMTYQPLGFTVDVTSAQGQRVRRIIVEAKRLGFRTVVLNFRGHMITGTGSDIQSSVPLRDQKSEEALVLETVAFAESLGLRVAFRPILLVVGPRGEFPYEAGGRTWWHGNIQPQNVDSWFDAYFNFHLRYLNLARKAGVEWYSIGAEMNSMTSGLGEGNPGWEFGYPSKWAEMIRKAKVILGPTTPVTYGINYTDEAVLESGHKVLGGELEQWRHLIVDDFPDRRHIAFQAAMRDLWLSLDVIGLDYYRALASPAPSFPARYSDLSDLLTQRTESHASQLNNTLTEISLSLGESRLIFFQEVGYRSVSGGFVHPATYEQKGGEYNAAHQAAAWDSFFRAYWQPGWSWMNGVAVWQILVDEEPAGQGNTGFSPLGKNTTEEVFQKYFSLKQ